MSDASITVDTSGFSFERLMDLDLTEAAVVGAEVIMVQAVANCPKESGNLAATAFINPNRGGADTVGFGFDSVYASYIHEHLHFKHPHGGQAKYQEAAIVEKKDAALEAAGEHIFRGANP